MIHELELTVSETELAAKIKEQVELHKSQFNVHNQCSTTDNDSINVQDPLDRIPRLTDAYSSNVVSDVSSSSGEASPVNDENQIVFSFENSVGSRINSPLHPAAEKPRSAPQSEHQASSEIATDAQQMAVLSSDGDFPTLNVYMKSVLHDSMTEPKHPDLMISEDSQKDGNMSLLEASGATLVMSEVVVGAVEAVTSDIDMISDTSPSEPGVTENQDTADNYMSPSMSYSTMTGSEDSTRQRPLLSKCFSLLVQTTSEISSGNFQMETSHRSQSAPMLRDGNVGTNRPTYSHVSSEESLTAASEDSSYAELVRLDVVVPEMHLQVQPTSKPNSLNGAYTAYEGQIIAGMSTVDEEDTAVVLVEEDGLLDKMLVSKDVTQLKNNRNIDSNYGSNNSFSSTESWLTNGSVNRTETQQLNININLDNKDQSNVYSEKSMENVTDKDTANNENADISGRSS